MSASSRQRQWQLRWHEILNDYPDPDGGDSVTPQPLPDLDADFRLQFAVWQLPRQARQRAFAILPCGDEMLTRVDRHLSAHREPLEPPQAIGLLRRGLGLVRDAGVEDAPSWDMQIDILCESDIPLLEAFMRADDPFYGLMDGQSDRAGAHHGEAGRDARDFLREPLYRLGGNAYQVADWVLWPLCSGPGAVDLTKAPYRLWQGGWSPGWTRERLFVFDRREELGLS
jgi:hypothetical protein